MFLYNRVLWKAWYLTIDSRNCYMFFSLSFLSIFIFLPNLSLYPKPSLVNILYPPLVRWRLLDSHFHDPTVGTSFPCKYQNKIARLFSQSISIFLFFQKFALKYKHIVSWGWMNDTHCSFYSFGSREHKILFLKQMMGSFINFLSSS